MKVIITAEPDEMADVLALIMKHRDMFDRGPERLGWGWSWATPSGKRFFLAQIRGGVSARPVKPLTPTEPEIERMDDANPA